METYESLCAYRAELLAQWERVERARAQAEGLSSSTYDKPGVTGSYSPDTEANVRLVMETLEWERLQKAQLSRVRQMYQPKSQERLLAQLYFVRGSNISKMARLFGKTRGEVRYALKKFQKGVDKHFCP